jgi:hypothetical protein
MMLGKLLTLIIGLEDGFGILIGSTFLNYSELIFLPNISTVFLDGPVTRELSRESHIMDRHCIPFSLIFVGLVNFFLCSDVIIKVPAENIEIISICQVVKHSMHHGQVSKSSQFNCIKHSLKS